MSQIKDAHYYFEIQTHGGLELDDIESIYIIENETVIGEIDPQNADLSQLRSSLEGQDSLDSIQQILLEASELSESRLQENFASQLFSADPDKINPQLAEDDLKLDKAEDGSWLRLTLTDDNETFLFTATRLELGELDIDSRIDSDSLKQLQVTLDSAIEHSQSKEQELSVLLD